MTKFFYAFPSHPPFVGQIITASASELRKTAKKIHLWTENDIVGRTITDPIFNEISTSDVVVCDITKLNFNVIFEAGFAIAKKKKVILTLNAATTNDRSLFSPIGIFDTLGYLEYQNTHDLIKIFMDYNHSEPLVIDYPRNSTAPI